MSAPRKKHTILIVDDHPLFRNGVATLMNAQAELFTCHEAATGEDALEIMKTLRPDAALVDVSLPDTNGIELVRKMRRSIPKLPILVLSMHEEAEYGMQALKARASGYLMKAEAPETIVEAILKIVGGETYFSPGIKAAIAAKESFKVKSDSEVAKLSHREREVLELLGQGLGTKNIAAQLILSPKTVETYRVHIREKLRLRDSEATVKFAKQWVAKNLSEES